MQAWKLQDAKARFSELVNRAQYQPQQITRHGKPVVVLMSQAEFVTLEARKPLHNSGLPQQPRPDYRPIMRNISAAAVLNHDLSSKGVSDAQISHRPAVARDGFGLFFG